MVKDTSMTLTTVHVTLTTVHVTLKVMYVTLKVMHVTLKIMHATLKIMSALLNASFLKWFRRARPVDTKGSTPPAFLEPRNCEARITTKKTIKRSTYEIAV